MPLITIIQCDECGKKLQILDEQETPGAEEVLQVTDATHKKIFHCGIICLRRWAAKYSCPYKTPVTDGETN